MTGDNFSNRFLRTSDGISEACKDWVLLIMRNLKGSTDFLEEGHLAAPLPSSQVSTSSAKSHLSYYDSPRSQPLALAPEVEEEMSAGAISSPSPPKRSLGLLRRNEPLCSNHWNSLFLHRLPPASPSSPGLAVTLTPPPPDSVASLGVAVLDLVTNRQLVNSNTN